MNKKNVLSFIFLSSLIVPFHATASEGGGLKKGLIAAVVVGGGAYFFGGKIKEMVVGATNFSTRGESRKKKPKEKLKIQPELVILDLDSESEPKEVETSAEVNKDKKSFHVRVGLAEFCDGVYERKDEVKFTGTEQSLELISKFPGDVNIQKNIANWLKIVAKINCKMNGYNEDYVPNSFKIFKKNIGFKVLSSVKRGWNGKGFLEIESFKKGSVYDGRIDFDIFLPKHNLPENIEVDSCDDVIFKDKNLKNIFGDIST